MLQTVDRFGGSIGSMRTAISRTDRTDLVHIECNLTSQKYRNEMPRPHALSLMLDVNAIQHFDFPSLKFVCLTTREIVSVIEMSL